MATPLHGQYLLAPDGTRVAFSHVGSGRPPVVLTNGLTTTGNFYKYLAPRMQRNHAVVNWDMPGHGHSSPAGSERSATIAGQPELLASVMDACRMESAIQVGWSTGCQVVLEFYRRHPERCSALVLLLGSAGRVLSTSRLPLPGGAIEWLVKRTPQALFAGATHALSAAANGRYGQLLPRTVGLIGAGTSEADAGEITEHLTHVDSATLQTMIASAQAHDAWDVLPQIKVPTYIVAGDKDPFAPAATVGVKMAQLIPNAQLLRLPEGTHTALLDHADPIWAFVEREFH